MFAVVRLFILRFVICSWLSRDGAGTGLRFVFSMMCLGHIDPEKAPSLSGDLVEV